MTYYDRSAATHLDGTAIFRNADDQRAERDVAEELQRVWKCEIGSFGVLAMIDWYAQRAGRLVAVLELKSRSHESSRYPTVFLNVRKWIALVMASVGLRVPAIYVVRFTDGTRYIPLSVVDAAAVRMGGTNRIVKSETDREPVIEVPISEMKMLEGS